MVVGRIRHVVIVRNYKILKVGAVKFPFQKPRVLWKDDRIPYQTPLHGMYVFKFFQKLLIRCYRAGV